jgi:hypothetical protein
MATKNPQVAFVNAMDSVSSKISKLDGISKANKVLVMVSLGQWIITNADPLADTMTKYAKLYMIICTLIKDVGMLIISAIPNMNSILEDIKNDCDRFDNQELDNIKKLGEE